MVEWNNQGVWSSGMGGWDNEVVCLSAIIKGYGWVGQLSGIIKWDGVGWDGMVAGRGGRAAPGRKAQ